MSLNELQSKGWQGGVPSGSNREPASSLLAASRGCLHSLACGLFLHLQSQQGQVESFSHSHLSGFLLFPSSFKDAFFILASLGNLRQSPSFDISWLIMFTHYNFNFPLPCNVTLSVSRDLDVDIFNRRHYSDFHLISFSSYYHFYCWVRFPGSGVEEVGKDKKVHTLVS